jgi:hypothetical protein
VAVSSSGGDVQAKEMTLRVWQVLWSIVATSMQHSSLPTLQEAFESSEFSHVRLHMSY